MRPRPAAGFCAGLRQELRELRAQMVGACTQDEFDDDSTGEMPSGTTLSDEGGAEAPPLRRIGFSFGAGPGRTAQICGGGDWEISQWPDLRSRFSGRRRHILPGGHLRRSDIVPDSQRGCVRAR